MNGLKAFWEKEYEEKNIAEQARVKMEKEWTTRTQVLRDATVSKSSDNRLHDA